jgi:hypothetical protein
MNPEGFPFLRSHADPAAFKFFDQASTYERIISKLQRHCYHFDYLIADLSSRHSQIL